MRLEIVVNRRISEVRIHAYNILILGRMFEQGGQTTCKNGTFADFSHKIRYSENGRPIKNGK